MRHALRILLVLILLAPGALAQEAAPPASSLKGKFLVADPSIPDPRFAGTVIFIIAHSQDQGALGVVINKPGTRRPIGDLMRAFGLAPNEGNGAKAEHELFWGGPVAGDRALLMLHSDEFKVPSTVAIAPGVALSQSSEALVAIADGRGPKQLLMAIGYSGWSPGQLERELETKSWAVIGAGADLLFGADHAEKWERAWKLRTQDL